MNTILYNTHKQENIKLLKVRDYYFNKAKRLNKWCIIINIIPVVLVIISLLLDFDNDFVDIFIGVLSIILWLVELQIGNRIDDYVTISNQYREEYDIRVWGLDKNIFYSDLNESDFAQLESTSRKVSDYYKYEIWYEEIFAFPFGSTPEEAAKCHRANIICGQADNIIYGKHVYKRTAEHYRKYFYASIIVTFAIIVLCLVMGKPTKALLAIISIYGVYSMFLDKSNDAAAAQETNEYLVSIIEHNRDHILNSTTDFTRCLQDMILLTRDKHIFVPQKIRNEYLEPGNPFYVELDKIKNLYYQGMDVRKPSCAGDIDILTENGESSGSLEDLHKRLSLMLQDVIDTWEKHGINYTLDGGTLIGAIREKGHFIFWDDDIDLAIPISQVSRAKRVIIEELSDKYVVQDYSEDAYSPRLSNFRVRDKHSTITEKDSVLSENYEHKGIFLDVYCYSPILGCRFTDGLYRRIFIHPLHKRLIDVEFKVYNNTTPMVEYLRMKQRYLKRVEFYTRHAKNTSYWCYTPNYLHFMDKYSKNQLLRKLQQFLTKKFWHFKKPLPYIPASSLWGRDGNQYASTSFKGIDYRCALNCDDVLRMCYGDYMISPYTPLSELKNNDDQYVFSSSKQVTSMKHIKTVKFE